MIKSAAIAAVIGYADQLADHNRELVVVPNTPLSEMVRNTPSTLVASGSYTPSDMETIAEIGQTLTQGTLETPSLHDQAADAYIRDLSVVVRAHIIFAKNVVTPVVVSYADNIRTALESMREEDPASQFNIDVQELAEPLYDATLTNLLTRYQDKRPLPPKQPLRCIESKTEDALLALMQFGEHELDQRIAAWYHRRGNTFFTYVWDYFFGMGNNTEANAYLHAHLETQPSLYVRGDIGLAVYLIANRLYHLNEPMANPLPLAQYQSRMAELRDYGGTLASITVARAGAFEKQNLLITELNIDERRCGVAGPVYRAWLEKGGSPELLYGLIVSGRRVANGDVLLSMKVELLQTWAGFIAFQTAAFKNKAFDRFKAVLEQEFNVMMNSLLEEERAYEERNSEYRTNVKKYLKEELATLRLPAMTALQATARQLICRARFYYTKSNMLLQTMEDVAAGTPELSPREAALLAAIDYVASYVSAQFTVVAH